MSIRKVEFAQSEFYHIYNRGNSKQKIFNNKSDYERFTGLLFLANSENNFNFYNLTKDGHLYDFDRVNTLVDIGAYCLMPNHFHILVIQTEKGDISQFMQKLTTAYVMYYNKKYERTGSLFEGKFRAEHVDNDQYLKYLFSYIHLNPIKLIDKDWKERGISNKKEVLNYLTKYEYSSYLDYLRNGRVQNMILNKEAFPDYFPTQKEFSKEIFEWINYDPQQII